MLFGGSSSNAFSASLDFQTTLEISKGTGQKTIDLTPYASTIQGYSGTWYIHVRHGSGSNSYSEFNGDEDSTSVKPQLYIEYTSFTGSSITASPSTCALGSVITYSITPGTYPNLAYHRLTYALVSSSGVTLDNGTVENSISASTSTASFVPPTSWRDTIGLGKTATLRTMLYMLDSNKAIIDGTTFVMCMTTINVPNANKPTVNYVSFSDTSDIYSTFGVYVQGHSTMRVTISASADTAAGASIRSYSTTVNGSTHSGQTFTIGTVGSSGLLTANTTVTDSMYQTATGSGSCTITAYSPPSVSNMSSTRCNASGTEQQDGTYMKVSFRVSATQVGSKTTNAVSYSIMYKLTTASGWTTYKTVNTGKTSETVSNLVLTGVTFAADKSYDIKVVASDYFQTSEIQEGVSTKEVLIDLMAGGKGIAFGKLSQIEGAVELGWPAVFHDRANSMTNLAYLGRNPISSDTVAAWVAKGFCYAYYDSNYLNQPTNSGFVLSMPYCTNTTQVATSATTIVQLWFPAADSAVIYKRYGFTSFNSWQQVGGGSSEFDDRIYANGGLTVANGYSTSLGGSLSVSGTTTFGSSTTFSSGATFNGSVTFNGNVYGLDVESAGAEYSTSEIDTGKTWINGRAIYRKVISLGTIADSGSSTYSLGATPSVVITIQGMALNSGGSNWVTIPDAHTSNTSYQRRVYMSSSGTITVACGSNGGISSGYLVVEYTK